MSKKVYLGIEQSHDKSGFVVTGVGGQNGLDMRDFLRLIHDLRNRLPHRLVGQNDTTVFEDANQLYLELKRSLVRLNIISNYDRVTARPLGARRGARV